MQVEVAETRKINHPLRNDSAITNDDDCVGLERCELSAQFFAVLDLVGLDDRQAELLRALLYGRGNDFQASAARLVRLRDDQLHGKASLNQSLERGNGKARRAGEREFEVCSHQQSGTSMRSEPRCFYHSPAFISLRILRFIKSRFNALMWLI